MQSKFMLSTASLLILSACVGNDNSFSAFGGGLVVPKDIEERKQEKNKKNENEVSVSPLFKKNEFLGVKYDREKDEWIDSGIAVDSSTSINYLKLEKEDGKETVIAQDGNSDNWLLKSKEILKDKNNYINIEFEEINNIPSVDIPMVEDMPMRIAHDMDYDESMPVAEECYRCDEVSREHKTTLKLGGNKANLTYTDFGIWKDSDITRYASGPDEVYDNYNFTIMYPHYNGRTSVEFTDYDKDLTFKGNTIAYLHNSNDDSNIDLTGKIELTFMNDYDSYSYRNGEAIRKLKIDFDGWKSFENREGNYYGNLYDETGARWRMDNFRANFAGPDLHTVNETVGNYSFYGNEYAKKCAGDDCLNMPEINNYLSVKGVFGAKSSDNFDVNRPNNSGICRDCAMLK